MRQLQIAGLIGSFKVPDAVKLWTREGYGRLGGRVWVGGAVSFENSRRFAQRDEWRRQRKEERKRDRKGTATARSLSTRRFLFPSISLADPARADVRERSPSFVHASIASRAAVAAAFNAKHTIQNAKSAPSNRSPNL